ncbi:hypothetical protein LVJ83_00255 [Uruburuella testudinis]|uniref:ERF1-like protein n=1 Tax=Uruburuella testudinis TaxID=1282863 RepID=A0ABY4DSD7_9NEIS|nr:hypothetical protein [Uruburuella testudinis]UOO81948.1 hypothetical protein LVJ83_00255 [Uruburuella testudinis]
MNLAIIKNIQSMHATPSVTITLPTNRTYPDNEKDAIRLKNLVNEAVNRLEQDYGKREAAAVAAGINRLADSVSHRYNLDGLVIFASADYTELFHLPFCLPERVTIADHFLTRDLVYALNRSPLYLLTVLSENGTRLFVGHKDALDEVEAYGFPFTLEEEIPEAAVNQDISHVRDQMITDQMREVGEALTEAQKQIPAPIVVVGVDRNIGHFKEGARNSSQVMLYINSGHNSDGTRELAQRIWPQIKDALAQARQKVIAELENAKSNNLFVGGLNEIWQAVTDGRAEVLVVEEDLHIPAEVSTDGREITELLAESAGGNGYQDIVDEIIEKTLATGGQVKFVDNGSLKTINPMRGMAVITRY